MKMLEDLEEVVRLRDAAEYANVYGSAEEFTEADRVYSSATAKLIAVHHAEIAEAVADARLFRMMFPDDVGRELARERLESVSVQHNSAREGE